MRTSAGALNFATAVEANERFSLRERTQFTIELRNGPVSLPSAVPNPTCRRLFFSGGVAFSLGKSGGYLGSLLIWDIAHRRMGPSARLS